MRFIRLWALAAIAALCSSGVSLAQQEVQPEAVRSRSTEGMEAERHVFELLGRGRPTGTVTYSFVPPSAALPGRYAVSSHNNGHSQGPSAFLAVLDAAAVYDAPRFSEVTIAVSGMWAQIASRSTSLIAARMETEEGTAFVVVEALSTYPEAESGFLPLHQMNIVATRASLAAAVSHAQQTAVRYQAHALAIWLAQGFPQEELAGVEPPLVPASVTRPKIPERRVIWTGSPAGTPGALEQRCAVGATVPFWAWENPYNVVPEAPGAAGWHAIVNVHCRACELQPPLLCVTGDPMWDVNLDVQGVLRRGTYYFEVKIDSQHAWHIPANPAGPAGDTWGMEVYWSAQLKEAFPLKAPFYDAGQLPPNHYWLRRWHCRSVCSCPLD
jgi:hypothetical protein